MGAKLNLSTHPSAARLQEEAVKLGLGPLTYYFKAEVNYRFHCLTLRNYLPPALFRPLLKCGIGGFPTFPKQLLNHKSWTSLVL